jgi:hypothetical protein
MTGESVIPAGKGSKIFSARGSVMAFKAIADQTSGDFSLMDARCRRMAADRCRTVTSPPPRPSSSWTAP